jgi:hypothetical protein
VSEWIGGTYTWHSYLNDSLRNFLWNPYSEQLKVDQWVDQWVKLYGHPQGPGHAHVLQTRTPKTFACSSWPGSFLTAPRWHVLGDPGWRWGLRAKVHRETKFDQAKSYNHPRECKHSPTPPLFMESLPFPLLVYTLFYLIYTLLSIGFLPNLTSYQVWPTPSPAWGLAQKRLQLWMNGPVTWILQSICAGSRTQRTMLASTVDNLFSKQE